MATRAEVEKWFIEEVITPMQPGGKNIAFYKNYFKSLSDTQFKELMKKLQTGEEVLPFYTTSFIDRLDMKRLKNIIDKLGIELEHHIVMEDILTGLPFKTPRKYVVFPTRFKRVKQHLEKGISVAEHANSVDTLTNQPVGVSRSSRLSLFEIQLMLSVGDNEETVFEFVKARGGDATAFREYRRMIKETGQVSIAELKKLDSRAAAAEVVRATLFSMMLENQL